VTTFNEASMLLCGSAKSPEEVFPEVARREDLAKAVRRLAAVVHPDANLDSAADANVAFNRLTTWAERAEEKFKAGTWGDGRPYPELTFKTAAGVYRVFGLDRREAMFDSLAASLEDRDVLLHMARTARYEPTISKASQLLRALRGDGALEFVERITVGGRTALVTGTVPEGFVSMESLMLSNPNGMPVRDVLRYALSVLRIVQRVVSADVVHGSINPATWWVRPDTAESMLLDWHYMTRITQPVEYVNSTFDMYCPWEVRDQKPTDRGTDMAAVMIVVREAVGVQPTPADFDLLISDHMREGRARPTDAAFCIQRVSGIIRQLPKPSHPYDEHHSKKESKTKPVS
jgi:hypothetical protein